MFCILAGYRAGRVLRWGTSVLGDLYESARSIWTCVSSSKGPGGCAWPGLACRCLADSVGGYLLMRP